MKKTITKEVEVEICDCCKENEIKDDIFSDSGALSEMGSPTCIVCKNRFCLDCQAVKGPYVRLCKNCARVLPESLRKTEWLEFISEADICNAKFPFMDSKIAYVFMDTHEDGYFIYGCKTKESVESHIQTVEANEYSEDNIRGVFYKGRFRKFSTTVSVEIELPGLGDNNDTC